MNIGPASRPPPCRKRLNSIDYRARLGPSLSDANVREPMRRQCCRSSARPPLRPIFKCSRPEIGTSSRRAALEVQISRAAFVQSSSALLFRSPPTCRGGAGRRGRAAPACGCGPQATSSTSCSPECQPGSSASGQPTNQLAPGSQPG